MALQWPTWGRRACGARFVWLTGAAGVVAVVAPGASAQSLRLVPSISITETLTDNRNINARDKQADAITQISPSVSLSGRSGALQGNLNYTLNGLVYARESSLNAVYHSLSSNANLQFLDGRAGLSAGASAGRQAVSAFGTQGADPTLNSGNQAQVFSYSLSPFFRGRLPGDMGYDVRFGYTASSSDAGTVGDSSSTLLAANLTGRTGRVGWGIDASRNVGRVGGQAPTHNSRLGASASFTPDVEWLLSLRIGSETDDLRTDGSGGRTTNWAGGVTWTPGPRTSLQLGIERRFFGRSHSLAVSHRMARTIWTASDSRNLSYSGVSGRSAVSTYDLLFAQLASVEPDPARRDALVRAILAADPQASERTVTGGFLSASPSVQRSQNLSMAYQGLRATFSVSLSTSRTEGVPGSTPAGDLAQPGGVRQQGFHLGGTHRLTPDSSLSVGASVQRTPDSGLQRGNTLRTINATWNGRLGPYGTVSLGARHSQFDSDLNPYHESALFGSLRMQF